MNIMQTDHSVAQAIRVLDGVGEMLLNSGEDGHADRLSDVLEEIKDILSEGRCA